MEHLIHELMVRDLSISDFMSEALVAHENARPRGCGAELLEGLIEIPR